MSFDSISCWFPRHSRSCRQIHRSAECYGIEDMSDRSLAVTREECDLCRGTAKRNWTLGPRGPLEHTVDIRDKLAIGAEATIFLAMNVMNVGQHFQTYCQSTALASTPKNLQYISRLSRLV